MDAMQDDRTELDTLAERGEAALRDRNVRYYLREGLPAALASTVLPPLLVVLVQFAQRLAGVAPWQPSAWMIAAAMLLTGLGAALLITNWARRLPVDRNAALGLLDAAAGAEERLVTADALLQAGAAHDPFAAAAIEDARWFLRPAVDAPLAVPANPPPTSSLPRGVLYALAGVALLFGAAHPLGLDRGEAALADADDGAVRIADISRERPKDPRTPEPIEEPTSEPAVPEAKPDGRSREAKAASRPTELPDDASRKEGRGGAGRSAEAQASRGESDARGAPSNQGQESKKPPVVKKPLKTKKKRAKRKKKPTKSEEPKPASGEESGSTAGKGSSQGSNRNPVTSEWTSKDQVSSDEEDEVEDDEEVEDEEVDSEARGGVQPNLRDRRPPVSRDLTIGFGNQPNPNANGRGGPSQPKKSRGTASLVLGVPIPDRIKGQPNPGKTKVTQERVEPRREHAPLQRAEPRMPRQGPAGSLAKPELTPWMRALLRDWFLRMRTQETKKR